MKLNVCLGLFAFLSVFLFSSQVQAADGNGYYFRLGTGMSYAEIDTAGVNTAGSFNNTDSHWDNPLILDVSVGRSWGELRAQLDFSLRSSTFVTASFPGLPNPTFFYDSSIRMKSLSMSTYYDFSFGPDGYYEPFVGAGAGGTYFDVDLDDGVVLASDSDQSFSYFGTVGIGFKVSEQVRTEIGYRYYDFGSFDVDLRNIGGGGPAGNFKGDLAAHEAFVGIRSSF